MQSRVINHFLVVVRYFKARLLLTYMKEVITIIDTVQTCNGCGNKIRRGLPAFEILGKDIYFCNAQCVIRKFDELNEPKFEDFLIKEK